MPRIEQIYLIRRLFPLQNENTFRLAMPHGLEYVLQASDESEMNEWVTLINWSAASKTLNIPTTSNDSFSSSSVLSDIGENQDFIVETTQSQPSTLEESLLSQHHRPLRSSPFAAMLKMNPANKVTFLHTVKASIPKLIPLAVTLTGLRRTLHLA